MIMPRSYEGAADGGTIGVHAEPPISRRQMQVLRLICAGLRLREVGERLGLSHRTVEHHKYQLMSRLNIRTSAQLVLYAARRGWV